jgi:DNA transformation protein
MSDFIAFVQDQLRALAPVSARRMFGGHGLYCRGRFFGLIADDTLYLRTDARNVADYTDRGLTPFKPWADRAVVLKAYYPVPEDVLEAADDLTAWARRALDAAIAAEPDTGEAARRPLSTLNNGARRRSVPMTRRR